MRRIDPKTVVLWIALGVGLPTQALPSPRPESPVAALDSAGTDSSIVLAARAAYQNAWAQRQAGSYDEATRTATAAIGRVTEALAASPDLQTRVQLNDLQARLAGLRDAAENDRAASLEAAKSGNEPDDKVLAAPAKDEIEPQVNEQVLHWIEFFTGSGRSTFERWLKRSGRYMELFRVALKKEGLPPDLVHLVFVESGFNVNARSVSAAVGPWQFLRGTARLFGLTVNQWVDERKDPEKSTVAAARYLKHLYGIFGDWPLALASYNAGEGTVLRAVKAQGTSNYWDLKLPRQTEDYVPQFMACLAISRDPRKYGFDAVPLDDPMEFDEVALKGAVDLRSIAKLAECSYEDLKQLNPAVLRHATNGSNGVTTLRVPRGKGEVLMQKLEAGARLPVVDLTLRHKVHRGETLQSIARHYHVDARRLALANGIGKKHPLRRGTTLTIPASMQAPAPAELEDDDPRASTAYVPYKDRHPRRQVQGDSRAEGRLVHTVRRGETLDGIAHQYGVSAADLKRWNRLKSAHVKRGTRLKVRRGDGTATEQRAELTGPQAPGIDVDARADAAEARGGAADAKTGDAKAKDADAKGVKGTKDGADTKVAASERPARSAAKKAKAAKPKAATIVVRRGDTLGELARQHGVTVRDLKRANKLTTSRVRAGQRLKLPVG